MFKICKRILIFLIFIYLILAIMGTVTDICFQQYWGQDMEYYLMEYYLEVM